MRKGTTKSGYEFELNEEVMDDMEFVDALAEMDQGNTLSMSHVIGKLFSKEEKKKLYNHVRLDGKVSVESVSNMLIEIFQAIGEDGKNS